MQHGLASGGCVSLLSCEHRAVAGGWDNEESRCRFWWLEVVLLFMLGPSCLQPFFPGPFFLPVSRCCPLGLAAGPLSIRWIFMTGGQLLEGSAVTPLARG